MRASRANLVVLLQGQDRDGSGEGLLDRLLPAITSLYPSRLLIVRLGGRADAGALRGSVSALCTLGGGARYLCCEKIEIEAGTGAEPSIAGTVLSLILGELPVALWVPGEVPHREPWFRTLLTSVDRILIDSSRFASPAHTFRALAHLTGSFERVKPADFEWVRLAPWRRAIAAAFDPPAAREAALLGLERITFFEPPGDGPSGTRGASAAQDVLAGESPADAAASASSLLLKAWISKLARVRSFAWSAPPAPGEPQARPQPDKPARGAAGSTGATGGTGAAGGAGAHLATTPAGDLARSCGPADEDLSRGIRTIRFEGQGSGGRMVLDIPGPAHGGAPAPADFAMLIGGQPDNPLLRGRNPAQAP